MIEIRRVAVLGAGTMGARIAAHCANAGLPVLLLDMTSEHAAAGWKAARTSNPPGFYAEADAALVTPLSFEEGFPCLAGCDWIIEAVTERRDIKLGLLTRTSRHVSARAIISTNTTCLPLSELAVALAPEQRRRFLRTQFFNPPRYQHLLELTPVEETDPRLMDAMEQFCDVRLGKGVVRGNDTPGYVANRIGTFYLGTVLHHGFELGLTIEEIDDLTGPLIGVPRTATFGLIDLIGVDTWFYLIGNLHDMLPRDLWRDRLAPPPVFEQLLARGWLGKKTGQGFYLRGERGTRPRVLDVARMDYVEASLKRNPALAQAAAVHNLGARLRALLALDTREGEFLRRVCSDYLLYSAERVPEIAPRIVEIDRSMRWGYSHHLGPFELWDTLGFTDVCDRLEREGRELPPSIAAMRQSGATSFYSHADEARVPHTRYFDLAVGAYAPLVKEEGLPRIAELKRAYGVVQSNEVASLIDLGDGVLNLEFHCGHNAYGPSVVGLIENAVTTAERDFRALLIANECTDFNVGLNLRALLPRMESREWSVIERFLAKLQQAHVAIRRSRVVVVAAPHGRTLGPACDLVLHAHAVQAAAELYMGYTEIRAGLVPAGGSSVEMMLRRGDPLRLFSLVVLGTISQSVAQAKEFDLLELAAHVTMNPDRLVTDAKNYALQLAARHEPMTEEPQVRVGGAEVENELVELAQRWHAEQRITAHQLWIATRLAHLLAGGDQTTAGTVPESRMLEMERELFLSLCGHPATQSRIKRIVDAGRPLRA